MHRRVFPCVLLLCVSSSLLAQNRPDFSGVYLRNRAKTGLQAGAGTLGQRIRLLQDVERALDDGSPLILVVTQTADLIETTKIQNGARSTNHYDLNGSKPKKVHSRGSESIGRAKFNRETLLIEYNAPLQFRGMTFRVKEKWKLSLDSRILTIQPLPSGETETFTRQPSVDSARARASEASLMNKCVCLRLPSPANARSKDWDEAELGFTAYRQLNTCVLFDAGFWGEFFKGFERSDTPNGTQFRKSGQVVSQFPDTVVLEVTTKVDDCAPRSLWIIPIVTSASPLPPELLGLRFRLRWTGSSTKDLGEVGPELLTEPWPELAQPERFYRMQIPSKGVPLTDNLEIRILTKAGNQIGCISGHI
jgi:hypothetical protein